MKNVKSEIGNLDRYSECGNGEPKRDKRQKTQTTSDLRQEPD